MVTFDVLAAIEHITAKQQHRIEDLTPPPGPSLLLLFLSFGSKFPPVRRVFLRKQLISSKGSGYRDHFHSSGAKDSKLQIADHRSQGFPQIAAESCLN